MGSWVVTAPFHSVCGNAITHDDRNVKTTRVFKWTPPAPTGTGVVSFEASIVRDFSTIYLIKASLPENVPARCPGTPECSDHGSCTDILGQSTGVEKMCACNDGWLGSDCSIAAEKSKTFGTSPIPYTIRWTVADPYIYLQVRAQTLGWIGLIVSHAASGSMDDADIWVFSVNSDTLRPYAIDRWSVTNVDTSQPNDVILGGINPDGINDLTDVVGYETADGYTQVSCRRLLNTGDIRDKPIVAGTMRAAWAFDLLDDFKRHESTHRGPTLIEFIPQPQPVAPGVPSAPRLVQATSSRIFLEWDGPADQGSEPLFKFDLQVCPVVAGVARAPLRCSAVS